MNLSAQLKEAQGLKADDLVKTFNTLIKYNEGEWRSERQARYMLKWLKGSPFQNDAVKRWARTHGFTNRDMVPIQLVTVLRVARDPSKVRYLAQVFIIDSGGVVARARMKYQHYARGRMESGIDWNSGDITFRRKKEVKPKVDIEAERQAHLKRNAKVIEKIKSIPGWDRKDFLQSLMGQLEDGRDLSPGQINALNKFFPKADKPIEVGDKKKWEQDLKTLAKFLATKALPWLIDGLKSEMAKGNGEDPFAEFGMKDPDPEPDYEKEINVAIRELKSKGYASTHPGSYWTRMAMLAVGRLIRKYPIESDGDTELNYKEVMAKAIKRKNPTKSALKMVDWNARAIDRLKTMSKKQFIKTYFREGFETLSFGNQLMESVRKKVLLSPGLIVSVHTKGKKGKESLVAVGRITELDPATHTVRVVDEGSGATLEIDVDVQRYDIWVKPPSDPVAREPKAVSLFVRPSKQGVYKGGQLDY